jgi:hypothetical protein
LAQDIALTVAATSASALTVTGLVGNIVATNLTGALTVTTADAGDNGISITTGTAATSVDVAAGAATDTVAIVATALANNVALTVTSGAAAAGTVNITGLKGDLVVSNPTSGTISIAVVDNTDDNGIAISAGAANLTVTAVADGDTVTVTGFTGATFTGSIAGTTGKFSVAGGANAQTITTGAGDDTITGGAADDTLIGGAGADSLNGQGANDTYQFATGASGITLGTADTVTSFATTFEKIKTGLTGAAEGFIADGAGLADFTAFVAAVDAKFTAGTGANDGIYIAYNAINSNNAYVAIDYNDSGSLDAGDVLIILNGVSAVGNIALGDFIA